MFNKNLKIITFIITISLSFIGFAQSNNDKNEKYKVIKIDSTEHNYLVYVEKREKIYLIVSTKEKKTDSLICEKIKKNKLYKFRLTDFKIKLTGLPEDMENSVSIDSKEVWKKGDDFDLYLTKNLVGLYYSYSSCSTAPTTSN